MATQAALPAWAQIGAATSTNDPSRAMSTGGGQSAATPNLTVEAPRITATGDGTGGPVRLQQGASVRQSNGASLGAAAVLDRNQGVIRRNVSDLPETPLGDFEVYVRSLPGGQNVRRFGSELMTTFADEADLSYGVENPTVPADYVIRPGDALNVLYWGSVDGDLRLRVDRSGRIQIPRVGPVTVAGVRYADLNATIARQTAQVFRNFEVSATVAELRGQRVFVTGFVKRPGAIVLGNLATLTQALLQAGGPAANGSYRRIELRRGRQLVGSFDLYDLLLRGDRGADQLLQADDVVHVGAVGRQVAVLGSVNHPAIFELKGEESLGDVLQMAGGFNAVADPTRVVRESLVNRAGGHVQSLLLPSQATTKLDAGDVLRAFNIAELFLPTARQNKRVRVDGEVARPGDYVLPAESTLADALRAAGGMTGNAFVYGTTFTRESVRREQQVNFERAMRDFETQLTMNAATRRTSNAEEAAAVNASTQAIGSLVQQLRRLKPSGRVVLQLEPAARELPPLVVEDGDRITVPARPTTVGVFGSVFSAGSYLHDDARTIGDYLKLAGGPTRGADQGAVFVVRANGTVTSSLPSTGFFSRGNQIANVKTEPGDTIFVPEELNKTTFVQDAKDWTQILYQFGLGIAGIKAALN